MICKWCSGDGHRVEPDGTLPHCRACDGDGQVPGFMIEASRLLELESKERELARVYAALSAGDDPEDMGAVAESTMRQLRKAQAEIVTLARELAAERGE